MFPGTDLTAHLDDYHAQTIISSKSKYCIQQYFLNDCTYRSDNLFRV